MNKNFINNLKIIGKDIKEIQKEFKENNLYYRIICEDGKYKVLTKDYRPERFNFILEKGKIVSYNMG